MLPPAAVRKKVAAHRRARRVGTAVALLSANKHAWTRIDTSTEDRGSMAPAGRLLTILDLQFSAPRSSPDSRRQTGSWPGAPQAGLAG